MFRAIVARLLSATLLIGACKSNTTTGESATGAPSSSAHLLGTRVELVARADQLALEAQKHSRERAGELLAEAVAVRERLYRLERRQVDALEAVELLRLLEKVPGRACSAAFRRALIEGEVRRDPVATYKQLHALRARGEPACAARIDRVLTMLTAYRPLPSVLAEIDREQQSNTPSREPASDGSAATPRADASSVVSPSSVPVGPSMITAIERYGSNDAARVVVFLTHPSQFQVGQLADEGGGARIFIDIDGATHDGPAAYEVGGLVQRVRVGKRDRGTRVVLDLSAPAQPKVFYLPEPFRLVVDVFAGASRVDQVGDRRVVRRVVLDPGHGGHDPGATGPNGLREKDVALDIAHRAAPLIARELGVTTLLTRDGDQYVALDERAARANAFHADLFVSIHCNASADRVAKGVMTFVLDQGREAVAQRLAARENAASSSAATELADALSRVADPRHTRASLRFAELLQRAATASLAESYPDIPDGGVKRAGFYVLAGARMPAVLFETSFISNSSTETRLNTGDFRQKMADAIVNAIRAYRDGH